MYGNNLFYFKPIIAPKFWNISTCTYVHVSYMKRCLFYSKYIHTPHSKRILTLFAVVRGWGTLPHVSAESRKHWKWCNDDVMLNQTSSESPFKTFCEKQTYVDLVENVTRQMQLISLISFIHVEKLRW